MLYAPRVCFIAGAALSSAQGLSNAGQHLMKVGRFMMYQITETDKRTKQTRIMAEYSEKQQALEAWRELAWQHVDDAQLWHKLEAAAPDADAVKNSA